MTSQATRLFLSIDIVHSKRVKAEMVRRGQSWLPLFRDLFESFPLILIGRMAQRFTDRLSLPPCAMWKALGDEIIFEATTAKSRERVILVAGFHDAIAQFDGRNREQGGHGVKGCCWEVPIDRRNEVITIPEMAGSGTGVYEDVIGPDMDIGFVMAKSASGGQTIVGASLAQRMNRFANVTGLTATARESFLDPSDETRRIHTFLLAERR